MSATREGGLPSIVAVMRVLWATVDVPRWVGHS